MIETDIKFEKLFLRVAVQDDEQSFEELFHEFYPALCVFAMRYIKQEETARDIVQDVFFKIWKNRKRIYIDTSFRNFVITSVRNHCIDFLRKKDLENRYLNKNNLYISYNSLEVVYTLNELEATISDALKKLPSNVREAFEMSRFKGMTYIAIANKMEVSPKTIESHISKALKFLRVELCDYLPFLLLFI